MFQAPAPKTPNPFMDPAQMSMADMIALIAGDEELPPTRRRNLTSHIRCFCKALDCEPGQVPANFWYYRERLKRFHPLAVNIKKKRWQTIKSDVKFALERVGQTEGQSRGLAPLSDEWLALKALVPSRGFFWTLSRLAHYCSAMGIVPAQVNDRVMDALAEALKRETFKTHPDRLRRALCLAWNKLGAANPALGVQVITVPSFRQAVTPAWDALSPSLQKEADAWLHAMSQEADILSDDGPIKPLRPASITSYRYAIRQAVAGLVGTGTPLSEINHLAVLVKPDNAKRLLYYFVGRNGGDTSSMLYRIAHVLTLIAEYGCGAGPETIQKLQRFRKQLVLKRDGMRPRPREALRAFVNPANIEKILTLPLVIFRRVQRKTSATLKDALLMQVAVCLELLLMRPIRRKNLVELQLSQSIIRNGRDVFIRLPSDQVKNAVSLDYKIPRESADMLDFYVKKTLPLLGPNPNGWLFPGEDGVRHKSGEQLGRHFSKTIREMTGLYFFPHLARHFGAFLYLNKNPGAFEVMRRVLAHKSLTTTTQSYASFKDDAALRLFDELILGMRDAIAKGAADAETK